MNSRIHTDINNKLTRGEFMDKTGKFNERVMHFSCSVFFIFFGVLSIAGTLA